MLSIQHSDSKTSIWDRSYSFVVLRIPSNRKRDIRSFSTISFGVLDVLVDVEGDINQDIKQGGYTQPIARPIAVRVVNIREEQKYSKSALHNSWNNAPYSE